MTHVLGILNRGAGSAIEGKPNLRGLASSPVDSGDVMDEIQTGSRRSFRLARKPPLSYVLLAKGRGCAPRGRRTGPPMAQRAAVCFSSPVPDNFTLVRVREHGLSLILIAPRWPKAPWLAEIIPLLYAEPWRLPPRTDILSQANGEIYHPHPDRVTLWAWPVRGRT